MKKQASSIMLVFAVLGCGSSRTSPAPVADPERPIEILRTVHSFDPCMACGVHVVDATGREITRVKVV